MMCKFLQETKKPAGYCQWNFKALNIYPVYEDIRDSWEGYVVVRCVLAVLTGIRRQFTYRRMHRIMSGTTVPGRYMI